MSDNPTPELLPCPFCGKTAAATRYVRDGREAFCRSCGASACPAFHGPNGDTEDRANAAWNTRPTPETADQRTARIVAALGEYLAEQDKDNWCQRLKYGQCSTRKCLLAGGWSPGNPVDYSEATCPRYRVQQAIEREFTPPDGAAYIDVEASLDSGRGQTFSAGSAEPEACVSGWEVNEPAEPAVDPLVECLADFLEHRLGLSFVADSVRSTGEWVPEFRTHLPDMIRAFKYDPAFPTDVKRGIVEELFTAGPKFGMPSTLPTWLCEAIDKLWPVQGEKA